MLKFWEKILWFLFIMSVVVVIVLFVWMFINRYTVPLMLPIITSVYVFLFMVYLSIKGVLRKKKHKQTEIKNNIEATYKKIQAMNQLEKNDFAISEAAEAYFEKVELLKPKLTPEEFSKYNTVLFGTEDPYIVTEEGKITVKACPGDFKEK